MLKNISLNDVNPHIICTLCKGYFIDPVTLVECLHSFCKTCIVKYVETNKVCPTCEVQIHKTRPLLSMKSDKVLQNIIYKLVPNLYVEEMKRRRLFQEKHEPTKVSKEELEKHFFFRDDKISMSIEYYDSLNPNGSPTDQKNLNRRYLECPGTVKVQHLKKFIILKYGLNEKFVIDIIYMGDIIPEDYTLIDVAYYYKWKKDAPMRFFYRIFKKTRVYLKRRKSRLDTEESNQTPDAEPSIKKTKVIDDQVKKNGAPALTSSGINGNEQHSGIRSYNGPEEIAKPVVVSAEKGPSSTKSPIQEQTIQVTSKSTCLVLRIDKQNPSFSTCQNKSPTSLSNDNKKEFEKVSEKKELKDLDIKPDEKIPKPDVKPSEIKVECNKTDFKSIPESIPISEEKKDTEKMDVDETKPMPKFINTPNQSPPEKHRILSIASIIKPNNPQPQAESKENKNVDSAKSSTLLPSQSPPRNIISELTEAREARCQSNLKNELEKSVRNGGPQSPGLANGSQKALSPLQEKPKQNKMTSGSQILSVINNLTKKQLNLEASLNKDAKSNGSISPALPSIVKKPETSASSEVTQGPKTSSSPATIPTSSSKYVPQTPATTTSHHIPSGTTITVKQIFSSSSSPSATPPTNGTPVVVMPNSLKSVSPKSLLSNVTILSPTEKSKQTLNDLRQFRKMPLDSTQTKTSSPSTQMSLLNKQKSLTSSLLSNLSTHTSTGSHKLPGNISAAGGLAAMKPINLSRPPPSMSLSDHQKALQLLKSSVSKNSTSFPTLSNGKSTSTLTTTTSPQQAQLPSSRLQLKVQQAPPLSSFQAAFQSTIYTQLAAETIWKHQQSAAAAVLHANMQLASNGKAFGGLTKTPNQGIRQIPNPSLFAKQQQEIMMAMAAAVINGGGDPRPNGERQ